MAATLSPRKAAAAEPGTTGRTARVLRLVPRRTPPAVPQEREARPATLATVVACGVMLVTALVVAFGAFLAFGSGLAQSRTQDVLYHRLSTSLKEETAPVSGAFAPGTPLGELSMPSIGVDQVFVAGSSSAETAIGPGLKTDSVLPGQAGLSVLVGRRATFGAPFSDLAELRTGDRLDVTTGQGHFTYVVDLVRTSDAPATRIRAVASRLTLVTSDPAFTPDRQLVVSAHLRGDPQPATTGTTAPLDNLPGHGTHTHATALLLWCQLLLIVAVVVTWAALRLPRRGLWIAAVPVVLAVLWNVYENLALLLPNTL
jgi:sortase A